MQTNAVIKLADIHKIYRTGEVDVHAVRGVSLDIQPGEFVAIMGSSGSGKSTLMNMIGCLDRPTSGSYLLDGLDVSTLDRDARAKIRNDKIGFVFQGFNLLSRTTALENVEMPMLYNHRRISSAEQKGRAQKSLELVGLATRADHKPNQLSGGQQQRVAIARALVNQPSLLLADEPNQHRDYGRVPEIKRRWYYHHHGHARTGRGALHEAHDYFARRKDFDGRKCGGAVECGSGIKKITCGAGGGETRMKLFAPFKLAGRALRRNKMRSLLTMLGIIIGVGSVIASVSVTTGASKQVEDKVASLGQNIVTVYSGSSSGGGSRGGWGSAATLTVEDANAIKNEVPNVVAVSPEIKDGMQVLANGLNWRTRVGGESPDFTQIRDWDLESGAMFTEGDVRSLAKVAVIGKTVVDQLFQNQDPVGQTLIVRNIPFKIVGVLSSKGFNLFGSDQDDVVVIPYSSHMRRITKRINVDSILVQAATKDDITQVQNDINTLLRDRHKSFEPDFTVRTQLELMQMATSTAKVMSILLGAIASVSLIVGGIGIMNIMLVSVTERTREIGIRMAVGARGRDILIQFLIEAVTLSAAGGLIGIALGIAAAKITAHFTGWPTPLAWVGIACISSAAIGIVSGFYPAWKASRLDPIEALRYE